MRLLPAGDAAILVDLSDGRRVDLDAAPALQLARALSAAAAHGVTDVVPAESTVLVRFDRRLTTTTAVADLVRTVQVPEAEVQAGSRTSIDVHYDGEDLAEAAELAGMSPGELVQAHTDVAWTVLFCGFAPGFGYLRCADRRLDVPRRDRSRTSVPAGSVALAAGYSGVYPRNSPGGWQLIGRTDAVLWDDAADPPALLRPGVQVRFRAL